MDVITAAERVRGKVKLTVNGGEVISIPAALYRERPMEPGTEFDLGEYEDWLLLKQYRCALDRAVGYLAARACSRGEIEQKLLRVGYRPQTVEMVLYKLESNDLLDDEAFAKQWAEARSHRKLGPQRIARELRGKGVSQEDAEAALETLDPDAMLEQAAQLARQALNRHPEEDIRRRVNRVSQMLMRRGYDWETIRAAISRAGEEAEP